MPKIGFKFTPKSKKKMSLAHKGQIPWSKGRKFSKASRKRMSKSHKGIQAGSKHPMWRGGFYYSRGYIYVWKPEHPFCECKGYVKRSRLVMEEKLNRYLKPDEQVHHLNGIKNDDRPENLDLFDSNSKHLRFHYFKRKRNKFGQFI